jgi:site-specific DNA-adenine methylase
MKIKALAQWFGSNRMLASNVGDLLKDKKWVGVPFAGGMSEIVTIKSPTILVSDIHSHIINLARVVADSNQVPLLIQRLDQTLFHPESLKHSQKECFAREERQEKVPPLGDLDWAYHYFVSVWLTRGGVAGTKREFYSGLSYRWTSGGGDSNLRFRSAIESISLWHQVTKRCTFICLDAFDFLKETKDRPDSGLYCDPPFPNLGDSYKYTLTTDQHKNLATVLSSFKQLRVVCRFYDMPIVRELYPESRWIYQALPGRDSQNNQKPELLLVNKTNPVPGG